MIVRMRIPNLDAARVLAGVLALALGLQVAWTVTGMLGARQSEGAIAGALPAPAADPLDLIKAARLFGALESPTVAAQTAAPASTQGLVLVGVLAAIDPKAGRAIIGESAAAARVYAVGGTLPGGSRLAEVYSDRVILDAGDRLETLQLPRQGGNPAASSPLPPVPPMAMASAGGATTADITNVIRWQAVMRTDKPSGVRVYPGANAQLFTQVGLRPGDLVLAINDAPLADQANSEQFIRALSGTPQARLTIERNGQTESLTLDLTSVAGGAPQALQRPGLN